MKLENILVSFGFFLVAFTLREYARAWVAEKVGDAGVSSSGRVTLNPLPHIDIVGTIILPLVFLFITGGRFIFGGARALSVDYWSLNNPRGAMFRVGISGPLLNFLLAVLISLVLRYVKLEGFAQELLTKFMSVNVVMSLFNLIPIPPLDGARILAGFLPHNFTEIAEIIDRFGYFILIALLASGFVNFVIVPVFEDMLNILLAV